MTGRLALLLGTSLVASLLFWAQQCAAAESVGGPIVRIAELEIDPGQLDAYKLALKEEIETSIRVEPGVLTLYAFRSRSIPNRSDCSKPIGMQLLTNRTCRVRISKHTKIGRGRW
jgi:Antibiotic biosynthesis monooxygenase